MALEGARDAGAVVRGQGLEKSFGSVRAVDGVDLEIRSGQVVALLGPNGAGKTTTLDMLLGLLTPDKGVVHLFGLPPRRALDAGDVGVMLQTGELVRGGRVGELLRAVAALYPSPASIPEVTARTGLDRLPGHRTNKLSGGEVQRVRFAIALVADPRLLVLDEPTAGLDVEARREFWSYVRGYAESGRTVLFSTHYLEEAERNADYVIVIAAGRIVAEGTAAKIKATTADRVIRCTLAEVSQAELARLPGVSNVESRGDAVTIRSTDADATLHAMLPAYPTARDIEVAAASLEDAFLALTAGDRASEESTTPAEVGASGAPANKGAR